MNEWKGRRVCEGMEYSRWLGQSVLAGYYRVKKVLVEDFGKPGLSNIKGSWGTAWKLDLDGAIIAYFSTAREARAHADELIAGGDKSPNG